MYGGQIQLTDIVWARETFINISKTDPENAIPMPEPIVITEKDFTLARLKELEGHLVTTELSIRSKGRTSKDNSYTLYAEESVKDLVEAGAQYPDMSIRINGDLNPTYTPDEGEAMIGKTVTVTGIMGLYNEDDLTQDETYPSYQIVPGNRPIKVDEDGNYVVDENGNYLKNYSLPLGAHVVKDEGDTIKAGEVLVKIPRAVSKAGDITGGLPRVTELFEARNPSNPAVVSEIDGEVGFGKIKRGNREITVTSKLGEVKKYMVPSMATRPVAIAPDSSSSQ